MADSKISSLTQDIALAGDLIPVARAGNNFAVTAASIAALLLSTLVGSLELPLDIVLAWEDPSLGIDTGISRVAPGELAIGNGTQGDASGSLTLAELILSAPSSPTSIGTAGTTGQLAYDGSNIYVCTNGGIAGAATWKAAPLSAV